MENLKAFAISLCVLAMITVIGLGISQQALDEIDFQSTDEFCQTKDSMVTMTSDAFGWMPMLLLAAIGGIAIAYVARYMGWLGGE